MSLDEHHTLERERRVADRQYNDALTAFDAALVRTPPRAAVQVVADASPAGRADGLARPAACASFHSGWRRGSNVSTRSTPRTAAAIDALVNRDHEDERSPSNSSRRR